MHNTPMIRKTAVLFPGQGSQFVGMPNELIRNFPNARDHLNNIQALLNDKGPSNLLNAMMNGPSDLLRSTKYAQLGIFAVSSAFYLIGKDLGAIPGPPSYFLGHSLGEITALYAAGHISLSDALEIISLRSEHMAKCGSVGTGMRAYLLHPHFNVNQVKDIIIEVSKTMDQMIDVANINSGSQIVVSGTTLGLRYLTAYLNEKDIAVKGIDLPVSGPFHSRFMDPARPHLKTLLDGMTWQEGQGTVVSNVTDRPYDNKYQLVEQLTKPVLWHQSIQYIKERGVTHVICLGPRRVLANLLKHENIEVTSIASMGDLVGKTSH